MKHAAYQEGLTLIEIMIAVAIFMILMLAISSSMPSLFKLNRNTTTTQGMSVYAKNIIDQTRSFWLTPATSTASDVDHYPNLTSGALPSTLPSVPAGLSCVTPHATAEVARVTAPISTASAPVYWTTRRSITVSCRPAADSTVAYTNFVAEIGRPE